MWEMVVVEEREVVGSQLVRNPLFVCRFDVCQRHIHFGENCLLGYVAHGFDGSVRLVIEPPANECVWAKSILARCAWHRDDICSRGDRQGEDGDPPSSRNELVLARESSISISSLKL